MNLKSVLIYFFLVIVVALFPIFASQKALSFPDNKGRLVNEGDGYAIRLVDTKGSNIKTAEAIFLVMATPSQCLSVIKDYDNYPQFMPNIIATQKIKDEKDSLVYDFKLKVAIWTIDYTLKLRSHQKEGRYVSTWEFLKGDIKNTKGSWEILAQGENGKHSLIRYTVFTDPGRFVPNWVANRLSSQSIPKMIEAIRERATGKEES